jgi:hypothetical protein
MTADSSLSGKSPATGLLSTLLGLVIAAIGIDLQSGQPRYTMGIPQFQDGIGFIVAAWKKGSGDWLRLSFSRLSRPLGPSERQADRFVVGLLEMADRVAGHTRNLYSTPGTLSISGGKFALFSAK